MLVREGRSLEREPSRKPFRELGENGAPGLHGLHSLDRARRLDVAEVGEELDALVVDQQDRVRAVEADEIEDVLGIRDEQRLLELLAQACHTVGHAFSFRYWRASR